MTGILQELVSSFTLQKALSQTLSTEVNERSVTCLHGIRFLSISWIVLAHTCLAVFTSNIMGKRHDFFFFVLEIISNIFVCWVWCVQQISWLRDMDFSFLLYLKLSPKIFSLDFVTNNFLYMFFF